MSKLKYIITLSTLLFSRVDSAFSQEWESVYYSDESIEACDYEEAVELSNDNVLVALRYYPRNKLGGIISTQPALALISEGEELFRKEYIKDGLCESSMPYLFEKNGKAYMLTTYTPDHDVNSDNYFKNFDNPPADAILGLYKLDNYLNVEESYEHIIPIDTFERRDENWFMRPDILSGYLYIFTAFEDDENITGSYIKSVSKSDAPRGHDSLFFFKMDFDGNILLKKGYEMRSTGNEYHKIVYRRQQMVKGNNGYVLYTTGYEMDKHGTVEYYDNEFNHIDTRYIIAPEHIPYHASNIGDHTVMRSNHNTSYVATISPDLNLGNGDDVRLYEFDDDLDNSTDVLPVCRYIERRTDVHDQIALRSIDMTSGGYIYFAYTLNVGFMADRESYVMIELLDNVFDTISTVFYKDNVSTSITASCIKTTSDDGVLLVTQSKYLLDENKRFSKISKFPASAFGIDDIEEAHAHNLHLAVAYPNPGGEVMNIRTGLRNAVLSVYDIQGRKIHEQEITDDVTSVDASNWQSGTYIWKLGMRNEELGMKEVESGKWVK